MSDSRFSLIPAVAFDHLNAQQIALLAALSLFQDKNGKCWPSQSKLAGMVSKSRSWVIKNLKEIESKGLVEVERDGYGVCTYYIKYDHKGREHTDTPCEPVHNPCERAEHITVPMNTTKEQKNKNIGAGKPKYDSDGFSNMVEEWDEDAFGMWWSVYPKKKAKGKAREAYMKALKKTDPATLLRGAENYAAQETDFEFTKHPTTWLNQECWDDSYELNEKKKYIIVGTSDFVMLTNEEAKKQGPGVKLYE
jgi:DNA-binding MarR family transcriptional regulator